MPVMFAHLSYEKKAMIAQANQKNMRLSFEKVLIGFFVFVTIAVIGLGILNYQSNRSYHRSAAAVNHTNEVLKLNARTLSSLQDLTVRGYITTGDSALLSTYLTARDSFPSYLAHLRQLTDDNPEQSALIDTLSHWAAGREALAQTYLAMYAVHLLTDSALVQYTTASRIGLMEIKKVSAHIAQNEEALLTERQALTQANRERFDISIALIFAVIVLLLMGCTVAVVHYIRQRKRFEKDIIQLNTDLEKKIEELNISNKEMESFSYSVSHDLRAPLRIIDGFAKIISDDHATAFNEEGKRFMDTIRSNAQHMGMLIDDLLNFSRISRKELNLREINMNALVENVIDNFMLMDKPNADIKVQPMSSAVCDEHLIRQVWINLLSNALKYSRTREKAEISISWEQTGTETVYAIRDNGVGFDMQYAGKLFGVFQRLHKASDYEGTGVGLALVQRIVTRHRGRVWAASQPGMGATFYFSLPKHIK